MKTGREIRNEIYNITNQISNRKRKSVKKGKSTEELQKILDELLQKKYDEV